MSRCFFVGLFCLSLLFWFLIGGFREGAYLHAAQDQTVTSDQDGGQGMFDSFKATLDRISSSISSFFSKTFGYGATDVQTNLNSTELKNKINETQGEINSTINDLQNNSVGSSGSSGSGLLNETSEWFKSLISKFQSNNQGSTVPSSNTGTTQKSSITNPAATSPSSQQATQTPEGGNGSGSGDRNGSEKIPYKLEPNQFKKVCGKNEYVLWWSIQGNEGKDLKKVTDKMQNSFLVLPSCEKLAECHCCCNTCTKPGGIICPGDICFSNKQVCEDGNKVCTDKCKCSMCQSKCDSFKEPNHSPAFDTDCSCKQEGCPKGDGCKIILYKSDSEWHWGNYQTKGGNVSLTKNTTDTSKGSITIDNSKPTAFKSETSDKAKEKGWINKLVQEKGQCCKCIPEEQAKEGPNGGGG